VNRVLAATLVPVLLLLPLLSPLRSSFLLLPL
jgi:hypothetical protein